MATKKRYYEDSHLTSFEAQVISCTQTQKGFEILLDATAFYPEGGGQAADTGTLGDASVLDTRERGEEIIHLCDRPLEPGSRVAGQIDWEARFIRMQQHSGGAHRLRHPPPALWVQQHRLPHGEGSHRHRF